MLSTIVVFYHNHEMKKVTLYSYQYFYVFLLNDKNNLSFDSKEFQRAMHVGNFSITIMWLVLWISSFSIKSLKSM